MVPFKALKASCKRPLHQPHPSWVGSALALAAGNEAGIGKTGLAIRLTEPDLPPVFAHVLPLRTKAPGFCGKGR
jgi:hypothetical protein